MSEYKVVRVDWYKEVLTFEVDAESEDAATSKAMSGEGALIRDEWSLFDTEGCQVYPPNVETDANAQARE